MEGQIVSVSKVNDELFEVAVLMDGAKEPNKVGIDAKKAKRWFVGMRVKTTLKRVSKPRDPNAPKKTKGAKKGAK
jgi:hypothetical protein